MPGRERMHQLGLEGVHLAQKILESTTWIELPMVASHNENACALDMLDGSEKVFDAAGHILRDPMTQLYVECKNYTTAGNQATEYKEFLAHAYSHTAYQIEERKRDPGVEFMWFTTHPFGVTGWSDLTSMSAVRAAIAEYSGLLGEVPDSTGAMVPRQVDDEIARKVAERVWLVTVSHRQTELTLTPAELSSIEGILNRKGRS
ncbi:MAG: hypothetical protein QM728_05085 [Gordonia sp. (in: high G+C Gram-positive bacteria)]|uniref:hypothetical protein n=1 Tax=Gordonia sp. (in: high G+C Gram-positive bacteria) TaxID=84139 RepID=UPI0039E32AFE